MDPVGAIGGISGGLAVGQGLLQFLDYLRGIREARIWAALFDADGTRLEGSERVKVIVHRADQPTVWWYQVEELSDYTFVRIPVISSGIDELIGQIVGSPNPDVRFWRWSVRPQTGAIVGGTPLNARVNFLVVGYRPKALMNHFRTSD